MAGEIMNANNLTMIDLFAGAGGLSEGLSEAGFHSLFASEIMPEYAKTYSLNHTDAIVRAADIRTLNAEEIRKEQIVQSAISTLSFSELEAIIHIFDELEGTEGILVASKIADRVGITRSVIVNALRKFESAGVIESRSSGMKGTYIKVVNDFIFEELDTIKKRKRK